MKDTNISTVAGMEFYQGKICDKDVVVVKCGIGKVNAAICTQILSNVFKVDAVINTGVAGSLNNDIDICDIVISKSALEHDMDVTPLGYDKGIIPDMETSEFVADSSLIELAKKSAETAALDVKVFEGKVVSGDQFIGTHQAKKVLRETFSGDCAEMEGAAIAHTAYLNGIPFLVIRAISDKADGGAEMDYPTFEKKAAANSIRLLNEMIRNY
jgi:adenosylhomocysteine nucleosidase